MKTVASFLISLPLLALPLCAIAQEGCNGRYDNGSGEITFQQTGNYVTANYQDDVTAKQGPFTGILAGNNLNGTWREINSSRWKKIRFIFASDFSRFEAKWGEQEDPLTNNWGTATRIGSFSQTINCFSLFHLVLLMGNLEMGAYEGYNSTWITRSHLNNILWPAKLSFALEHIEATNCLDNRSLLGLRTRIQGFNNTNSFYNEIRAY